MSGQAAFLLILMRSLNALVDEKAQQDPQYCGMCWLRGGVL